MVLTWRTDYHQNSSFRLCLVSQPTLAGVGALFNQIIANMRYLDVLAWGMEHIAQNHGFAADTDDLADGSVCIYGGSNVPTLQDVIFLCEDMNIPRENIDNSEWGIEVEFSQQWYDEYGKNEYEPTGMEMWKRYGFVIGM